MKKIILLSIILLLTGCYDYVEIDDIAIMTGMIIDYKDNMYEITSQIIENENESKTKIYITTCKTITDCISDISKSSNKEISISHLKILVLTENLIKSESNYYDYFLRNPKSKMNFYIYTINNEDKDKIFNIYNDDSSSIYIKELMDFNSKVLSSSVKLSFIDLIYKKEEYGIEIIYPNITINDDKISLQNLIFYSNGKITLNDTETIFYNMLTNNINKTVLEIPCNNNTFSLTIDNLKTKYKWKDNIFNIKISIDSKITDYNCNNDTDTLSKISNKFIKDNISNIITIAKDNNYDFIGIGNYIYKHDYKFYNSWNNKLKDIKTNITVDTVINSIGETRK